MDLSGRRVDYAVRESRTARRCRIRVSAAGVEVVLARGEPEARAAAFLRDSEAWVLDQLAAQVRLPVRRSRAPERADDSVLFRGKRRRVEVVETVARRFAVA